MDQELVSKISNIFDFLIPTRPAALALVALLWSGARCFFRISYNGAGIVPAARCFLIDHRHRKD